VEQSLLAYRRIWDQKPVLREVYLDIFRRILGEVTPGPTLEIGGGSGNFKTFAPELISTDIVATPWLDLVCDAQRLPFPDATFANIVMVDVLHHIGSPLRFLQEAERVLRPDGRLVFCEPAITPMSALLYRLLHVEPVDMSFDPLTATKLDTEKSPWDSNQAIPTLLVGRYRAALARTVLGLALEKVTRFSFLAYPLSGGFQPWSLLPRFLARPLLKLEWLSRGLLGPLIAFRMLAVYRKAVER
jgi:SAM-dependent methyltransferase